MAANLVDIPFGAIALAAATAKSVVGVKAAANVCFRLTEVAVSFDGATSTAVPPICEFMQSTFGANSPGTNSTSVTPAKRDTGRAETVQATAARNWTTEPTTLTLQRPIYVGAFNGLYHVIYPFASPFIVIGGQGAVLRLTAAAIVNASGHLSGEE